MGVHTGCLIVFEGIDGSGKSTQAKVLTDKLLQNGHDAILTREPGGTSLSETLGIWLKQFPKRSALTEVLLFSAARTEHINQLISPALTRGQIVVCDRYTGSTIAYQGHGKGIDLNFIQQVNSQATTGIVPSLTFLLDIPFEIAQARKDQESLDVFEQEQSDFYQKVREGYLGCADSDPGHWIILDGSLPSEHLSGIIWGEVAGLLKKC